MMCRKNYLVKKGLPFREAHSVVGQMVYYAVTNNKNLDEFTPEEFAKFSDIIGDDIYDAISMETCVNDRKIIGGPAKATVENAIAKAEKFIEESEK